MKKFFTVFLLSGLVCFSQNVVSMLKTLEGSVTRGGFHVVYDDANRNTAWNGREDFDTFKRRCKGKPTIGYGVTDKDIVAKCRITEDEAMALLISKTNKIRRDVLDLINVQLTYHQREALVCFTYNIGITNFRQSTLLKRVNAGRMDDVPHEMSRWVYVTVDGQKTVSVGLRNRRIREIAYFKQK